MPQLTLSAAVQLVLLLSAFPAQYFVHKWCGNTAEERLRASSHLIQEWKEWSASYLDVSVWHEWTTRQVSKFWSVLGLDPDEEGLRNTMDTMLFDNDQGFFGASKEVRSPRPPYVFLRVGEVVMERKAHRIGVVVSWDTELRAPAQWVDRLYSRTQNGVAEKTPHYKVLFSGTRPEHVVVAYLPQTQLRRVTGTKPNIPILESYFTHFDGERFFPLPWLKEIFPEDDVDND
ncbi:uncharacterized protein si:dkey-261l7.2 [Syngnathoides biaculeatus]|uniref:uncharacterized protein si:dkey-261l7.2 n=1 Tax=Syngnathoides biaculeatus TaxID=300417 RepID=UPI002ADE7AFC|nr:uncharacterized protein si:dkey-261l7.2 [Syngnathoides biaculeatus]XP_061669005.1 uncharacterized protein si:dkey-261l7.2 [Syngnathoides biaculeatus]